MKSISAAAIAFSLVIGSLTTAHADERDYDRRNPAYHSQHRDHRDDRYDDHKGRDYGKHHRDWDKHDSRDDRDYRRGYWQGRYDAGRYIRPHGYYHHAWRRGDRLPAAYYANRYVVRNYGAYRLRNPPRGHHWVRVDRDVVLTAIATGVIVSVVSDVFH